MDLNSRLLGRESAGELKLPAVLICGIDVKDVAEDCDHSRTLFEHLSSDFLRNETEGTTSR